MLTLQSHRVSSGCTCHSGVCSRIHVLCLHGVVIRLPWGADEKLRGGKVTELFVYDNFSRAPADEVDAGDICAVTGLPDVSIGETICSRTQPEPLPTITVSTAPIYATPLQQQAS